MLSATTLKAASHAHVTQSTLEMGKHVPLNLVSSVIVQMPGPSTAITEVMLKEMQVRVHVTAPLPTMMELWLGRVPTVIQISTNAPPARPVEPILTVLTKMAISVANASKGTKVKMRKTV